MAMLRRVKDKIKKIIKEKKRPAVGQRKPAEKRRAPRAAANKKNPPQAETVTKKEFIGTQEITVERAKFSYPGSMKVARPLPQELPGAYGKDKMVLNVRDPWWLYTFWEVSKGTFERVKQALKDAFHSAKKTLRVYDVTNVNFNGSNANRYFDIDIHHEATSWYIDTGGPNRSWCVDYGLKLSNGEFVTILRSNIVHTPSDGPSHITDEEWMIPDEMFGRLYGMGFGFGQSSPVGKAWQERMKRALFSGVLASPGITSAASPVKKRLPKDRNFWFVLDCELIVYGATEPNASVTVQGKPIKLRPDGTFTMRFALPDGKQVIPCKAVSFDQVEERAITPTVSRDTKREEKMLKEFTKGAV
ncbi:MAG: DUF4912 domain-containing protein [Candidatus Omnitrophota bacterium]|jgi:hypothetical protein